MESTTIKVCITTTEDLLGTASNNPNLHDEFVASRAPDEFSAAEEVEAVSAAAAIAKAMTVFPRDENGNPFLFDYQIKGFFKDSAAVLRKVPGTKCSKIKAYKKEIDGLVFVYPRKIKLNLSGPIESCQRPLRASTPLGERIALANSESAPAGTNFYIEIDCLTKEMEGLVRECLDYGKMRGLGQWRNSGKGRFTYEEIE